MTQTAQETTRMVELITTVAKLPDHMQALAMGYAKGLADAAQLHPQPEMHTEPPRTA